MGDINVDGDAVKSMEMAVKSMEMMEMAPRAIPRPGRVPEQRLLSLEISLRRRRCCRTLSGKTPIDIGFSCRTLYIGGGAMSEGTRGAHTMWWRGQWGGRHPMVWPPPGPPL
jgi:hypothetical protein